MGRILRFWEIDKTPLTTTVEGMIYRNDIEELFEEYNLLYDIYPLKDPMGRLYREWLDYDFKINNFSSYYYRFEKNYIEKIRNKENSSSLIHSISLKDTKDVWSLCIAYNRDEELKRPESDDYLYPLIIDFLKKALKVLNKETKNKGIARKRLIFSKKSLKILKKVMRR